MGRSDQGALAGGTPKAPFLHWVVAAFVFLYFVVHGLLAWMDS
jgi:hypothetical protein